MRQSDLSEAGQPKVLVGVATEVVTTYGRSILRGVTKYANLSRKWVLHKNLLQVPGESFDWPKCDGTIMAGLSPEAVKHVTARSRFVVSCSANQDTTQIPTVAVDNYAVAAMAAEHLIDRGLRHFALYTDSGTTPNLVKGRPKYAFARRAHGFHQTLQKHGFTCINFDDRWPTHRELLTHGHHPGVIRWLHSLPKPIGILASDDVAAHDLAEACREANIGVPDYVAILGVNNDDLLCESAWPPLSSVEVNFTRMGYLAASTLDRLIKGEKLKPGELHAELPPIRIHQRMSTDVLAIDHPDVVSAVRYIREHACDPCTVSDVMKVVPVARRSLERRFFEVLGRSLHDEIARVRVEAARRLLLQPELSILNISERCGFSAIQSFNRFFLQSIGATPSAFRKQSLLSVRVAKPNANSSNRPNTKSSD